MIRIHMAKVKKPSCEKKLTLNHTFLVKEINKTLNGHDPDLYPHEVEMNLKPYKENWIVSIKEENSMLKH